MQSTLTAQLAALDLGGLSIASRPGSDITDMPSSEAMRQTVDAVWNDLFAMMEDTALEAEVESIAWGFVNLFHRGAMGKEKLVDRATDEIRMLVASADGSEIHTSKLEEQVDRAQLAEACQDAFEEMRERAAALYLNETGSSWRPATGSRLNHNAKLTSAVVAGRSFMKARNEANRKAAMPEGTPVIFGGGRITHETDIDAKTYAENIWSTLEKVRGFVPDMVLVHGGDMQGADRLAGSWAERNGVQQIAFGLERRLGNRAGFKRNGDMLGLNPRYVVAFQGNGVLERLVIDAKRARVQVVDRRGPLGTNPKLAAKEAFERKAA